MYINEVVRSCDALYPNQYTLEEKYHWCDEFSAILTSEVCPVYETRTLETENGDFLLPEDLGFEQIERIRWGSREMEKRDFRSYGIRYIPLYPQGRVIFPEKFKKNRQIEVVYQKGAEPVRVVDLKGVSFLIITTNVFEMVDCPLLPGDMIRLTVEGQVYDDVAVTDIGPGTTSRKSRVTVIPPRALPGSGLFSADIFRYVTDKTVCPAPYDRIYVDYLCGKICFYQRDFEAYNQHMAVVNSRLSAYERYLKKNAPLDGSGQLKNWW
jgi:hypothetical protein|nr:MAG TPA: Protein of unknown function (DUF2375) [Caudoviricetes sp.]